MASQLPEIAQALLNPGIYSPKPTGVELIQTQMSFIFLAGNYVYKLKKPVNLGYLDYTSLEKRRFYCEQEVQLNRRLCPQVYLDVLPVTLEKSGPALQGSGETVDYVVKMLKLPQDRMLNVLLDCNRVQHNMLEKVAGILAEFHAKAASNPAIRSFGELEAIKINTDENFSQSLPYVGKVISTGQFHILKNYHFSFFKEHSDLFKQRVADAKIRDCHGDLHAQHICFSDNIYIYDCIEFNDRFRYCDVASEIAFLAMDLDHYGRADLSRTFINTYLSSTQDHQIRRLLKFYKIYRAHVRAKVACFKSDDPYISDKERKQSLEAARGYFELATSYASSRPRLFITVGFVGSGKSTVSQIMSRKLGLTALSSDIIRKQLAGISPTEHRFEGLNSGIYSNEFSQKTYAKMYSDAEAVLKVGDSVILDATFLKAEARGKAADLAKRTGADFYVIECKLDEANTRLRLTQRLKNTAVSDGRWELYEPQKRQFEPVNEFRKDIVFSIDSAHNIAEQVSNVIAQISG